MDPVAQSISIFISYSHLNRAYKLEIETYLKILPLDITILSDDLLKPGEHWPEELRKMRAQANIFLLLVSPDYMKSKTVANEVSEILTYSSSKKIFPVILEPCEWTMAPFAMYQAVPKNGKPVSMIKDSVTAYREIAMAVAGLITRIHPEALWKIGMAIKDQSEELDISGFDLSAVPEQLADLKKLQSLILKNNAIRRIEHLENLNDLRTLDLSSNLIEKIENLSQLRKLKVLNLANNRIQKIELLNSLTGLETLELRHNQISKITGLNSNIALKILSLSHNQIRILSNLSKLKKLEKLHLSHNQIQEIYGLNDLSQLKEIHLSANKLTTLKPLLWHIRNGLRVTPDFESSPTETLIMIGDNKTLSEPSPEVVAKGNSEILRYFEEAERFGLENLDVLKLVLVGNSRVGKTNFSEFIRTGTIQPDSPSTQLLDIKLWDSPYKRLKDGPQLQINVFDFGGQDYYHDAHRLFYSYDTAYIILWEEASNNYEEKEGAEGITYENFPLEYWLESINYNLNKKNAGSDPVDSSLYPPILIIQNKIDKGEASLDQRSLTRKYENIKGFFNVALLKNKRTRALKEMLSEFVSGLQLAGRTLLSYELPVVSFYMKNNKPLKVFTMAEFHEDCIARINDPNIIFEVTHARILAEMLNNMGLVYFDGEDKLFTNVLQLNTQIKKVMELAKKGQDKGIFYQAELKDNLLQADVLALLVKNNSIIRIGEDVLLAPQFLPFHPEERVAFFLTAFRYRQVCFEYKAYFHKHILLNLFAKYLEDLKMVEADGVKNLPFWRNGILVSRTTGEETEMVLVEFKKTNVSGTIHICTLQPFAKQKLEGEIMLTLEELNRGWTVEKKISADSKDYFDVVKLKQEISEKRYTFSKGKAVFTINDLKHMENFESVPKKLFICYSSNNSDFIRRFSTHLQVLRDNGLIDPWYDRMLEPGTRWDETIHRELMNADLVIMLVSPDFLANDYVMRTELPLAKKQFGTDDSKFFFIEVQPCSWELTVLAEFQQTTDPQKQFKEIISIGEAGNDGEWKKIITALMGKLR